MRERVYLPHPASVPSALPLAAFLVLLTTPPVVAAAPGGEPLLPSWDQLARVLSLRDYNTRVVVLGTMLLGAAAGVVGSFLLLRKRALMGDAVSHATLPGIGLGFIVMALAGGSGKWLPGLLGGALVFGLVGMGAVLGIRSVSRVKEDAALGIVLSVFFGLGAAVLGVIQSVNLGQPAGLESFIYGQTAAMLASDAQLIGGAAVVVALGCAALYKELTLLCFDPQFAGAQGWPVRRLDAGLMALVVAVTVIGLQAVGLILVVALLVIPSAAARFWTERLPRMLLVAGLLGALSGLLGAAVSALLPRMPAGAVIVVISGLAFAVSMVFGPARGLLVRGLRRLRLQRRVAHQNLMRALYEWHERQHAEAEAEQTGAAAARGMSWDELLAARSWRPRRLRRLLGRAERRRLIRRASAGGWRLTDRGLREAQRIVRNHRLWELFLIEHAEIAPSHVDRDADRIEHVLGPEMIEQLERLLTERHPEWRVPPSPHAIGN